MKISPQIIKQIDAIEDKNTRMHQAAAMYVELGFYIVPIRPNGKLLPSSKYNFNYQHATKNIKKIDEWWGRGGKFEGWNIGIATGKDGGAFVLDLDLHGDKNGIEAYDKIKPNDYHFAGPIQETPSGGYHMLFEWGHEARNSCDKLAIGIDTRGGTADACRGHIVVWPSSTSDGQYTWKKGGKVGSMPQWLIDLLGVGWTPRDLKEGGRGNENMNMADVEDMFNIKDVHQMLSHIDPSEMSYEDWVSIGMAIHTQHPDEEGYDAYEEWCRRDSSRFRSNDVSYRWGGFTRSGGSRMGTLIHHATQGGYDITQRRTEPKAMEQVEEDGEFIDLVESMNKTYSVVPMGLNVFIVQDRPNAGKHKDKFHIFSRQGFRDMLESRTAPYQNSRGKIVEACIADIWLADVGRREYPNGLGMFPNKPQGHDDHYNVWSGLAVKPEKGDWSKFKAHVFHIICNNDKEIFEWVLDWMADLVQNPEDIKGTAIVMSGIEGCGKGTFAEMLGTIFGSHYGHVVDEEHLIGRFNGHLINKVLVFADEVTYGGSKKTAGKLKALVTDKRMTSEKKGIDAVEYDNCAHILIASNEKWFIPAGKDSRRWLVLDINGAKANNIEWFGDIHEEMENGGLEAMLFDLLEREVTANLRFAPDTQLLRDQKTQTSVTDSCHKWVQRILTDGMIDVPSLGVVEVGQETPWPSRAKASEFYDTYDKWCQERRMSAFDPSRFGGSLKAFGIVKKRVRIGGERVYVYEIPPLEECVALAESGAGIYLGEYEDEKS